MPKKRKLDKQTKAHIERFLQGSEVWNAWANKMLAEKEVLEQSGKWNVHESYDGQFRGCLMSYNEQVQAWLDEAFVDFSDLNFEVGPSSDKIALNTNKIVHNKSLVKTVHLFDPISNILGFSYGYVINFSNFIFPSGVNFHSAKFNGRAKFNSVKFYGRTVFSSAKFISSANFSSAEFKGVADFSSAKFKGAANFSSAEFKAVAGFISAEFKDGAEFSLVTFHNRSSFSKTTFAKTLNLIEATFGGYAQFSQAKFYDEAHLPAIHAERAFDLSGATFFNHIPNYTQAHFLESPRLDNITVLEPIIKKPRHSWQRYFWNKKYSTYLARCWGNKKQKRKFSWGQFTNKHLNPDEEAHYRALKRLAIQAHDHDNEMKFFAGEIRSRRHITDCAMPWAKGFASSARYWAGIFYELTSNFGRSLIRPLICWFAVFFLFSHLYLSASSLGVNQRCENSAVLTARQAANTISLKNALLVVGLDRTDKLKRAYACLYGAASLYEKASETTQQKNHGQKPSHQGIRKNPSRRAPDIPFYVNTVGIVQSLLSLIFIFLFLLALRNQFKIK